MRRAVLAVGGLVLMAFLVLMTAQAQEVCPVGTVPLPWGVTRDQTTDLQRQTFCVDKQGHITTTSLGSLSSYSVYNAAAFPGANAGTKIAACFAALPATGGTCGGRGLECSQSINQDTFAGISTPVTLLLGDDTYTINTKLSLPSGCRIEGVGMGRTLLMEAALGAGALDALVENTVAGTDQSIQDLTVDLNAANNTGTGQLWGIHLARSTRPRVRGVEVKNFYGHTAPGSGVAVACSPCYDGEFSFNRIGPYIGALGAAISSTVGSAHRASNVVTLTLVVNAHILVGETVTVSSVADATFNGEPFTVTDVPASNQVRYAQVAAAADSQNGRVLLSAYRQSDGLYVYGSNNRLIGNVVSEATDTALLAIGGDGNVVSGNEVSNSVAGIFGGYAGVTTGLTVQGNTVSGGFWYNGQGIFISKTAGTDAQAVSVSGNTVRGGRWHSS